MDFAGNLERLMAARGLSRRQLAQRLGITQQAVGQWFRAVEPTFPAHRIQDICAILGVTPNELLGDGPGVRETQEGFDDAAVAARLRAEDDEFAEVSDAVLRMLREAGMPTDQRTIAIVAQRVWRDVRALGRQTPFTERLELTLSERRSAIERKWREAIRD
ncbi:MAG: XRE family transcriptional regulator [Rhodospirillales bacterium]|nr:XRE family transcriptional regulator [Rhodospirillales bacterium]